MSPGKINLCQFACSFSPLPFPPPLSLARGRERIASVIRRVHDTRPRFVFLNGTRVNTLAKRVARFLVPPSGVLFSSILHGSRYNFYWFPRVDNIRFEHSGEMNCNICRAKLAGIFSSGGSIDRKANNEHFRRKQTGRNTEGKGGVGEKND